MAPRAPRMTADDRREAILEAVIPLLQANGPTVTTRQIADAAGVAEGTIFRVYDDKRTLLVAAAERAVAPPGWREAMAAMLTEQPDLRSKVVVTVGRMRARTRDLMVVLMALRTLFLEQGDASRRTRVAGPPAFLAESARQLLSALEELVFAPHASELSVTPDVAARVLRDLVSGGLHPGSAETDLLPEDVVADVLLRGVTR